MKKYIVLSIVLIVLFQFVSTGTATLESYEGTEMITKKTDFMGEMAGYEVNGYQLEIDKNGYCILYLENNYFDDYEELQKYLTEPYTSFQLSDEDTKELAKCIEDNSLYRVRKNLSSDGCDGSCDYLTVYYNGERTVGGYLARSTNKSFDAICDKIGEVAGDKVKAAITEAEDQVQELLLE